MFSMRPPTEKLVKADRNGHDAKRSNQNVRQMRGRPGTQQAEPDHSRDTQVLTQNDLPGLETLIGKKSVRTIRSPMLAATNATIEATASATGWLNMVSPSICIGH